MRCHISTGKISNFLLNNVFSTTHYFINTFTDCRDGEIRLMDGSNPLEGRLEVCYDRVWGTVCSDSWGQRDIAVACRQLGYSSTGMDKSFPVQKQEV